MLNFIATHIARPLAIRSALRLLGSLSTHALVIAPTTRTSIAFAQALGVRRSCVITSGPITTSVTWPSGNILASASEIAQAFAGQPTLTQTILSFPDQMPCTASACVMVPFRDEPHAFSTLEAGLALRHRPRVFAFSTSVRMWGFRLVEVRYDDAFDAQGQLISVSHLVNRLLLALCTDLADPPADWLARDTMEQKSERALWLHSREEMKDIECLLRMQLQSRFCDHERTGAALAAVVQRQRALIGATLP
jgi:hypothetical protein